MKLPFLSTITQLVGIDLGTSQVRIWTDTDGLALQEASFLAVDDRTQRVVAAGNEAASMIGRVGDQIKVYQPIQNGELYDLDVAKALLKVLLQRVLKTGSFLRPVIMASIPASSTAAQRQAMIELLYSIGAREAYTISQPLAAAIGAGVPIADSSGTFIVQAGSGLVEGAVISLGSLVAHQSTPKAGTKADQDIQALLRHQHSLIISQPAAEMLKNTVGSLNITEKQSLVTGKDTIKSSPTEVMITSGMIQPPLMELAEHYQRLLKQLFAKIPPELTVDIIDKGILLSGGLAQLDGLDQYFVSNLGVSVSVVEDPTTTVVRGLATTLQHLSLFKDSLGYQS